jgi:hypothetical protein
MEDNLSFSQLLDLLTDLVDKKTSGTLFIRSACNHAVTIGLEKGRIYALFYGAKRARNAIPMIGKITSGSYKFESSALTGIRQELPSTPEILNQLRSRSSSDPTSESLPGVEPLNTGISAEKRDRLCQQLKGLLAEYLGPIAQMVFDDAVEESGVFYATPEQANAFIQKLTLDIDDAGEVEDFRNKAYEVFDKVLFG